MENERIIPEGFEKDLLKSYDGWDEMDTLVYQFYNCELVDSLEKFQSESTAVCVDLNRCVAEIYNGDEESPDVEIPFSLNVNLTVEE